MNRFWVRFSILLFILCISGCGSGGGTTGNADTVFIQASIKDGSPLIGFANFSSNGEFVASTMSYTIKSTPYSTTGSIPNSDVIINKAFFTYTPVSAGAPAFTPTVASKDYAGLITPGGTLDIENVGVFFDQDMLNIIGLGASGLNQYRLDVRFQGVEVNTGTTVSSTASATYFVDLN